VTNHRHYYYHHHYGYYPRHTYTDHTHNP
jgi:hypothetical protein